MEGVTAAAAVSRWRRCRVNPTDGLSFSGFTAVIPLILPALSSTESSGASAAERLQPGEGSRNTVVVWQEPASVNTATTLECETTLSYVGRLDLQSLAILENRMLRTGKIKNAHERQKCLKRLLKQVIH